MHFLTPPTLFLVISSFTICSVMSDTNKGGYWPTWANDIDRFRPANIDTSLFTHVYYAFLAPNQNTFELVIDDTTASTLNSFTTTLHQKNPPVKTLFSIGGGDFPSTDFSRMASSRASRGSFIRSTIQVARTYGFDGVDLDWEYPQTQTEMVNFGVLLDEWRVAVNEEAVSTGKTRLLLSAATRHESQVTPDSVYPVESINKNLDWINAMTYDYHGSWDVTATGTLAALNDPAGGTLSTSYGLQSWIRAGIQREKLVMGLPLFGRTWRLQDPGVDGIGAPAVGLGPGNDGAMLYSEVQDFNAQNNAKVVFDQPTVSYYSVAGTSWIGYDDVESVKRKIEYAQSLNIGGYFFWTIIGDRNQDWKISRLASETWTN